MVCGVQTHEINPINIIAPGHSDVAYIESNYVDNGKRVSVNTSVSDNGLELTKTIVYRDEAAYDEYAADSRIAPYINAQITYNRSNNISLTSRTSSET